MLSCEVTDWFILFSLGGVFYYSFFTKRKEISGGERKGLEEKVKNTTCDFVGD